MKVKNWLWPLVLIASAIVVIVGMFLNFFANETTIGSTIIVGGQTGIFADFSGYESPIFATLTLISLIIGAVGVVAGVIFQVLKLAEVKLPFKTLNTICAFMTLIGAVALFAFSLVFMTQNAATGFRLIGQFGLYMALGGLIIGTIAAFLGGNDLHPRKAKTAKRTTKSKKK